MSVTIYLRKKITHLPPYVATVLMREKIDSEVVLVDDDFGLDGDDALFQGTDEKVLVSKIDSLQNREKITKYGWHKFFVWTRDSTTFKEWVKTQ